MMIIVVLVGVLATLATYGVLKYVRSSRVNEALGMVTDIKAAEEIYRDETLEYLGVPGGAYSVWHPDVDPGNFKTDWNQVNNDAGRTFRTLAVTPTGPVYFVYTVVAGSGGAPPSADNALELEVKVKIPGTASGPWYVVVARGNLDGSDDGLFTHVIGHSFGSALHVDREGQ
jgi:Tfp pilus assembly protein PilE